MKLIFSDEAIESIIVLKNLSSLNNDGAQQLWKNCISSRKIEYT